MFATATRSTPHHGAHAYARVGVETGISAASPHHLVLMLFDGFLSALAQARGALRERQIEAKCRHIGRAIRIINEGLRAGLNREQGGDLAADLDDLYAYVSCRLTAGHAGNDDAALDECRRLVEPLRDAWAAIAPGVAA